MTLLPPATNAQYEGSQGAWRFLLAAAVATIVPGSIHAFLPDGGAGSIAGLDLSVNGPVVVGAFAWAGATQIVHGLAMAIVALRYRPLVPAFLALVLLERAIMTANWWWLKPAATGDRPPEVYATLLVLPLAGYFLLKSLRRNEPSPATGASRLTDTGGRNR